MTNKLEPCPFCGERNAVVSATSYEPEDREAFAVSCRTRDCHGVIFSLGYGQFPSRKEAITAWNTRSRTGPVS